MPFLLLPFRPASDPSAARSFIRNYFDADKNLYLLGEGLEQELRLTEPMVSKKYKCDTRPLLIFLGPLQHREVVLEQIKWRRGDLGSL